MILNQAQAKAVYGFRNQLHGMTGRAKWLSACLRGSILCAATAALTACVSAPELRDQSQAVVAPTPAGKVLIVVDGKMLSDTEMFNPYGDAYMQGLATGLQQALPHVETSVIKVNPMSLGQPVLSAISAQQPAHVIRLWTPSITKHNDMPVRVLWEMDVANAEISKVTRPDGKRVVRSQTRVIYKARAEGDVCAESDSLANRCGQAMGKLFADTLRTGNVMTLPPGT